MDDLEYAEATISLAREQGFAQRLAAAQILAGWAHVVRGRRDELETIRRGLDDFKATGAGDDIPYWLALLAETELALGEHEAASRDLDEAPSHTSRRTACAYGNRKFAAWRARRGWPGSMPREPPCRGGREGTARPRRVS